MILKKERILAIDPGTRHMGVALLEGGKLIYRDVKVIKKQNTPQETIGECRRVISRLIHDLEPHTVVIEKTFFAKSRHVALLNVLFDEIKAVSKRKGLKVVSFAPSTVKKFICGHGRASKFQVATVMVARFPDLKVFLTQDRAWKERFHQNMFDAVALGVTAISRT
jgi:Holliday junction resolvasome RuvABC endonuclease subunit